VNAEHRGGEVEEARYATIIHDTKENKRNDKSLKKNSENLEKDGPDDEFHEESELA